VGTHGLATAIKYVEQLGMAQIAQHERALTQYAMQQMRQIPDLKFYGETEGKDAVVAFNIGNIHPLDLGTLLDRLGIAIRTGHHCAQPLMQRYGVESMARASFALYNTREEVDQFVAALERVRKMF
jgi:cysteine desulfurase/selenocysteine lyase